MLVPTYADLTTEANWLVKGESNAYNGMIVAVGSDKDPIKNGIYRLFDKNNPGAEDVPEVTNEDNWYKLAELSDLADFIEQLSTIRDNLEALGARLDKLEEAEPDVLTYGYRKGFPSTGEVGKLYIAVDEGKSYVWFDDDYLAVGGPNSNYEEPDLIYGGSANS
jgi:hypothetical protein